MSNARQIDVKPTPKLHAASAVMRTHGAPATPVSSAPTAVQKMETLDSRRSRFKGPMPKRELNCIDVTGRMTSSTMTEKK
jgi:hypothetical protein